MDLRQLRYFLAVAESGAFSRAAERAHIAQPALSAHVARLEEELGVQLFVRTSKGVELTRAGSVLVDHAHDLLRSVQFAQDAVRNASEEVHGEIALGLPTTVSIPLMLPLLQQVRGAWPGIALRLVEGHSGWLLEWLQSGRLDAAVLFGAAGTKGLAVTPLLDEDLYLIARGTRPEGTPDTATLAEAAALPLMLPARGHGLRTVIERAAAGAELQLNVAVEIDALVSLKKAVAGGLGWTILSYAAVADEVARGELHVRRIVAPAVARTVVLATRDERARGLAREKVAEALKAQIVELVNAGRWPARLRM